MLDPNAKAIIKAAKSGDIDTIRTLLRKNGSLIEVRDRDGSTPLHCAAWKGHAEVVELLLDAGADIDDHNENGHWGMSPLHAAAHGNQRKVAEVLLARGASLNAKNQNGETPLAQTEVHNAKAVAKLLRDAGAS